MSCKAMSCETMTSRGMKRTRVMLAASLDRLKLRVEALEKTPRMMVSVKRGAGGAAGG